MNVYIAKSTIFIQGFMVKTPIFNLWISKKKKNYFLSLEIQPAISSTKKDKIVL